MVLSTGALGPRTKGVHSDMAVAHDAVLDGSLPVLDRICATAAEICGSEAAIIAYNREGKTRILASHGIDKRFRIYPYELKGAPFKPKQFVVKSEAEKDPYYGKLGTALGISTCKLFIRAPISITKAHSTSLIVLSGTTGKAPADDRLGVLRETAVLARDQLSPFFPLLDDDDKRVSVLTTLQSMIDAVTASKELTALVDDRLCVSAISKPLLHAMRRKAEAVIGRPVADIGLHAGTALAFLFRKALDTGISLPDLEVVRKNDNGGMEVVAVHASPLSPTDTPRSFLYVSVRDVTSLSHRETLINSRIKSKQRKQDHIEEPSLRFLLDTLVQRRTLRERNGVSYLTIESWRQSIRTYQIAALKALKRKVPAEMSEAAATRIADEIGRFVGKGGLHHHRAGAMQPQRPRQLPVARDCPRPRFDHRPAGRAVPQPAAGRRSLSPQEERAQAAHDPGGEDTRASPPGGRRRYVGSPYGGGDKAAADLLQRGDGCGLDRFLSPGPGLVRSRRSVSLINHSTAGNLTCPRLPCSGPPLA